MSRKKGRASWPDFSRWLLPAVRRHLPSNSAYLLPLRLQVTSAFNGDRKAALRYRLRFVRVMNRILQQLTSHLEKKKPRLTRQKCPNDLSTSDCWWSKQNIDVDVGDVVAYGEDSFAQPATLLIYTWVHLSIVLKPTWRHQAFLHYWFCCAVVQVIEDVSSQWRLHFSDSSMSIFLFDKSK